MEQMQILLAILVLLPFVSALLLALCGSDRMRRLIVYGSAGVLMISAVAFAVCFFSGENLQLRFLQSGGIIDHTMLALEAGFAVLITVLSIKYRRYYVAVLSIVQTVLTFVYELGGHKPAVQPYNLFADQLTVIMVLIIAVVGTLITVYAVGYMRDYHNHHKEYTDRRRFFFAMLYVFLGAMFGLVLSNSLLWLYFFWEITSLVSFLLIGYTRTKEAVQNSFRALWMNLLGGLGFAAAIFWAGVRFGITDLQSLILCDGKLVVAPVMYGTYAGSMVSLVGGFTFLITSMLAITVSDGKAVLAYSTISNLGLIAACAGVGRQETVWAAVLLLIFHAVSKSLLFQTVGAIENATGSRDIESMHGLIARHPRLALTLSIGIAGMFLAPFGMLISKWAALKAFVDSGSIILVLFICFGSATTLFYWTKWVATVLSWNRKDTRQKNTTSGDQWTSLLIHSVLMVLLCFAFPAVSKFVVTPYLAGVYGHASAVLSSDNILIMIIMLVLIFVVPMVTMILLRRSHITFEDTYLAGVNTGKQTYFYDAMGEPKHSWITNWYLTDLFGETKLWSPSVVLSTAAILIYTVIALGGAVR